jgi:RNA polymerase sigma-70 factor (ECF subfamily)
MSDSPSDSQAIGASLSDPTAFGVIFERHYDAVHGYLQRRLDRARADELASQTFLVAFDQRSRFDRGRAGARPWLYGIATNLAHNHRRHEIVELRAIAATAPENVVAIDGVEARLDAERLRGRLAHGLAELPAEEADVLCLLVWADLNQAEIADALQVPLGTVKSRLSRARGRLRKTLETPTTDDPVPSWATPTGGKRWTI